MVWTMSKTCAHIINCIALLSMQPIDINQSKVDQLSPKVDKANVDTSSFVESILPMNLSIGSLRMLAILIQDQGISNH